MSRVVGHVALLSEVQDLLVRGESVALHGPTGIGKSALLDALESDHRERGALVLRASGALAERGLPYAALQDLLDQLPAGLPDQLRAQLVEPGPDRTRALLCAGFRSLLAEAARDRPVLLLVDDLQWLDPQSVCVIGYGRRRLAARVGLVATVGPTDQPLVLADLHHLEVPPLDAGSMIELLGAHGVPAHVAQRLHVESGGLPSLALALGGAAGEQPVLLGRPTPLPASLERVLRERYLAQDDEVRTTLAIAALLHRPTVRHLERAGRGEAERQVRSAAAAGLVTRAADQLRFTPSELRRVVAEVLPAPQRARWHRALAAVAPDDAERERHEALADPYPDARRAGELAATAAAAAAAGRRAIATELYLLAADRAPSDLVADRVEWLTTAVETGAPGNHVELVHRALDDLHDLPAQPAQTVRVRLALPELAGSGVAAMDEVLTAALADAGDDDRLVALVLLQRSRVALMESHPAEAARLAERAAALLHRSGDAETEASARTTLAVATRWTGAGDHDRHLAAALALAPPDRPSRPGSTHTSPAYIAARFALYDDRLETAWTAFRAMLARVERGAGMDQVHVLRCLVEVGVRLGRCREATAYAARAARVGEEFGLDAHTGWFITALAELAGGDLREAGTLAGRGAVAAEERGDMRYLQRHLLVLGQAQLRSGDAAAAHQSLDRIRAIELEHGISDPTVNRWQPELASALVALGRLDEAGEVLGAARRAIDGRAGTDGVGAQLDRAEAELCGAGGDADAALDLLDRAAKVCADIGMRVELGRVLLTRSHVERRARRAAAARASLAAAESVFAALHAAPWLAEVRAELAPAPAYGADCSVLDRLTDTEARIARLAGRGASNRQIAERLHLSVKTVEAALTRVYRKLEVRSRTQLAALLAPAVQ